MVAEAIAQQVGQGAGIGDGVTTIAPEFIFLGDWRCIARLSKTLSKSDE